MATAILLLSNPFYFLLHHPVYRTFFYSMFVGLTLGAALFCSHQVKEWRRGYVLAFLTAGLVMFFLTLPQPKVTTKEAGFDVVVPIKNLPPDAQQKPLANYDISNQRLLNVSEANLSVMLAKGLIADDTTVYQQSTQATGPATQFVNPSPPSRFNLWLFFCGMLGICALLLPGISGSYLMTILGAYPILIAAVADLSKGLSHFTIDSDAFFTLLSLFMGMIVGAVIFSRLLSRLLKTHQDITIATLMGCMLGALPAIWPFWSFEYQVPPLRWDHAPELNTVLPLMPDLFSPYVAIAALWVIVGFFTVFGLEHLKKDAV